MKSKFTLWFDFSRLLHVARLGFGILFVLQVLAAVGQSGRAKPDFRVPLPIRLRDKNAEPAPTQSNTLAFVPAASTNTPLFINAPRGGYIVVPTNYILSTDDLNGDLRPDLLVFGGSDTASLGELLGNGDGTYQTPGVTFDTGGQGAGLFLVADVNGDGKPDVLAVDNCIAGNCTSGVAVGVMLGNGDGSFKPAVTYIVGPSSESAMVAKDINGDGKIDLLVSAACGAATPGSEGCLSVLLGKGDGTFQSGGMFDSGGPYSYNNPLVAMDINRDGKPDAIIDNSGGFGILMGKGDGTFLSVVEYPSHASSSATVVVQDFNGDGKPDILIGGYAGIELRLGNGDGTFKAATSYLTSGRAMQVVDLNHDGRSDIVTADLTVMLGNGDGTFQSPVSYASPTFSTIKVQIADVNGDGNLDLAAIQSYTSAIQVLLGDGNGHFQPPVRYGAVFRNRDFSFADLNGDGKLDAVAIGRDTSGLEDMAILLNNRAAKYETSTTTLIPNADPANVRQTITYTATVSNPSGTAVVGTITFLESGTTLTVVPLVNNQATYGATYPKIGGHTITAAYSGDSANNFSSATITEYIRGASKMVLTTSGSPSLVGQPVTFTSTITSTYGALPDGDLVTFYDGAAVLASAPLTNGTATFTTSSLLAKGHVIKAVFPGDNLFVGSSRTLTQTIQKYSTVTKLTASPNPLNFGQVLTLSVNLTSTGPKVPTGKVKFLDGTIAIGTVTISGGVATLAKAKLAIGTHPITAQYLGDPGSAVSTSSIVNVVIH